MGSRKDDKTKKRTPGEEHELGDDLFGDDLLTYEINGVKTRVHLRKHPNISRGKIDQFNKIRYGSSEEGTSGCNLLLLPHHFVPLITPATLPGQVTQKPPSPLVLTQNEIFDHIMSLSEQELRNHDGRPAKADRNEMFFRPDNPSSPKSPQRQRKKKVQLDATSGSESGMVMMGDLKDVIRFGVSFKDDAYGVQDDEDLVDDAILHDDNLQKYDFIKQRRGGVTKL
jgi:hypothetical protein